MTSTMLYLDNKNKGYPLVILHVFLVIFARVADVWYVILPRQVVGVLHPAVAVGELDPAAFEVLRRPADNWHTHVLRQ